jgi:hypothetical protein
MTEQTEIIYAGSSIFMDFAIDGGVIPATMSCTAKLVTKEGVVANTYIATPNLTDGVFELRIPYTDTTAYAGVMHTLLVRVTDTATSYSDVIYDKKISWR